MEKGTMIRAVIGFRTGANGLECQEMANWDRNKKHAAEGVSMRKKVEQISLPGGKKIEGTAKRTTILASRRKIRR